MNFLMMDLSGYSTPVLKSTSHNSRISNSYSIGFITVDETYENSLLNTLAFVPLHLYLHNERKKKRSRIPTTDPPKASSIHPWNRTVARSHSLRGSDGPRMIIQWSSESRGPPPLLLRCKYSPSIPRPPLQRHLPRFFFFPSFQGLGLSFSSLHFPSVNAPF